MYFVSQKLTRKKSVIRVSDTLALVYFYTILLFTPFALLLSVQVPQWIFLISPKKQQIIIVLLGRSPAVKQTNELMSTKNARKPEMCFIFITRYNGPLMGLSSRDWIGRSKGLLVDYIYKLFCLGKYYKYNLQLPFESYLIILPMCLTFKCHNLL